MRVDRRQVLLGSLSVVTLTGCLNEASLADPFELRIENRDSRSRRLWVMVDHVSEEVVYEETHELAADEQFVEPELTVDPGRYRIEVVDTVTDEEPSDQLHVELSSGEEFCGWFQIWAAPESVTATVPRCPDDDAENDDPEADD